MTDHPIRFFSHAPPGQTFKRDWTDVYLSEFPVAYRDELMGRCQIHAKDGILRELFDREILAPLQAWAEAEPLFCVDLLSAYGDSFLATVHGMTPEEIFEAWSTPEKSLTGLKPRRFPCRTLGIDLSGPALGYGQRAGIFDDTLAVNINALSADERVTLAHALGRCHYLHLGAPGYIGLDGFRFIVDAFAAGSGPGYLVVAFNYLFMAHHKAFKQCIVETLRFINCVGGMQRYLLPDEVAHYGVSCAYSTTWVMERKRP